MKYIKAFVIKSFSVVVLLPGDKCRAALMNEDSLMYRFIVEML